MISTAHFALGDELVFLSFRDVGVTDRISRREGALRDSGGACSDDDLPSNEEDVDVDVEECSEAESVSGGSSCRGGGAGSTGGGGSHRAASRGSASGGADGADGDLDGDLDADEDREGDSPSPSPKAAAAALRNKSHCNCPELLSVECHLETKELWDKFHDLGTEMIITKTGR